MQQSVEAEHDLDKCAEIYDPGNGPHICFTDLRLCRKCPDAGNSFRPRSAVGRRDQDRSVIGNIDLRSGFFGQCADHGTALSNNVADLFRIDLEGDNTRCMFRNVLARLSDRLFHYAEDVPSALTPLFTASLKSTP